MRLMLAGCEYSGTTTLSYAIAKWVRENMGERIGYHDHWKLPHINHAPIQTQAELDEVFEAWAEGRGEDPTYSGLTPHEQELFNALTPRIKECFQRYHIEYHISQDFYSQPHHNIIGMQYDEAVYAPLYYGYGGPGQYADRELVARRTEEKIMRAAPDTVLVLTKAAPEVIAARMSESPHPHTVLQEKDIEYVLEKFEDQYERSLIMSKFTVDTSTATVEESLSEFVSKYEPLLTDADRTRILVHKARQKGEWI